MKQKVDWLRLLQYLEHAGTMLKNAPKHVLRIFGDLYTGVTCVVRLVKARFFGFFDSENRKANEVSIIIDHDASVLTMLSDTIDEGYIFATWDKHLTELVELKSRVYADTPSRVVDFLSMASGSEFEIEQTVSLLDSLVYCDERKAEALAKKIEAIRSSETAFQLQKFTDEARGKTSDTTESLDIVSNFFSELGDESA